MAPPTRTSGQALVETALTLLISLGAISALSGILLREWQKLRCAYQVFEATHAALIEVKTERLVQIQDSPNWILGRAQCGYAQEEIKLWKLESLRP